MKGKSDYFKTGSWNVLCDCCQWKYKAEELRKQWDGLMTCVFCYEKRNPQDFVRGRPDGHALPFTRPEGTDQFVDTSVQIDPSTYPKSF